MRGVVYKNEKDNGYGSETMTGYPHKNKKG